MRFDKTWGEKGFFLKDFDRPFFGKRRYNLIGKREGKELSSLYTASVMPVASKTVKRKKEIEEICWEQQCTSCNKNFVGNPDVTFYSVVTVESYIVLKHIVLSGQIKKSRLYCEDHVPLTVELFEERRM